MFAVYTDDAIYGIGQTIAEAVAEAVKFGFETSEVVARVGHGSYSGGIVDFTHCKRINADCEAAGGADGKIRLCTDALAKLVATSPKGGAVQFEIRGDGYLDVCDE